VSGENPEKKLSKREAAAIRLENQYAKWLKASASKLDIEDLLRAGKISAEQALDSERRGQIPVEDIPTTVSGMDALGSLIMRNFPKIGLQVGRQTIKNWRALKYVPNGCNVPFPPPSNGNRYKVSDCFAWIQTYFGPRMDTVGQPDPLFGATQELENKIKERKLRLMDLEVGKAEGKLTDAKVAQSTISAALKRYHGIVRTQLERVEIKAITDFHASLGLSDAHRSALREFHTSLARATMDKIEAVCELVAKGEDAPEVPQVEIQPETLNTELTDRRGAGSVK
jgi:hypothetical protein